MYFLESFLLWLALLFQKPKKVMGWPNRFFILGHRGANQLALENTIPAFVAASQYVEGVELDVHLSHDGIPVVIHDETLDRTTSGSGRVADYSVHVLERYGVPTLEKVLSSLPKGFIVNVELKSSDDFSNDFYLAAVREVLKTYENQLCLVISSFDAALLIELKEKGDNWPIALLYSANDSYSLRALFLMKKLSPDAIHIRPYAALSYVIRLANEKGIKVTVWTVNNSQTAVNLKNQGIQGLITDDVEKINNRILA